MFNYTKSTLQSLRPLLNYTYARFINTTSNLQSDDGQKKLRNWSYKSVAKVDEGTQGEKVIDIDSLVNVKKNIFPDEHSETRLFDGVPFNQLPICNVRVTSNNTIVCLTSNAGLPQIIRSCGVEGFKNTKKGTNIAAQATAISLSMKALERGYKTVRVRVRGLGPGRLAAIKGLQMGGLNIVSVTDSTRVSWNPPRPRKAKRL